MIMNILHSSVFGKALLFQIKKNILQLAFSIDIVLELNIIYLPGKHNGSLSLGELLHNL